MKLTEGVTTLRDNRPTSLTEAYLHRHRFTRDPRPRVCRPRPAHRLTRDPRPRTTHRLTRDPRPRTTLAFAFDPITNASAHTPNLSRLPKSDPRRLRAERTIISVAQDLTAISIISTIPQRVAAIRHDSCGNSDKNPLAFRVLSIPAERLPSRRS